MRRTWTIGAVAIAAALGITVGAVVASSGNNDSARRVTVGLRDTTDATTTEPADATTTTAAPATSTSLPGGFTTGGVYAPPVATGDPVIPSGPAVEFPAAPATEEQPGVTTTTVAPCTLEVVGFTLTAQNCGGPVTALLDFYYVCPPGTDLPATIPGGTVITTCPHLVEQRSGGIGTFAAPSPANCMMAYVYEVARFVGYCG